MTTLEWAQNEIRLTKAASGNDNYFALCCDSAIKAFQSLMNDNHSGCSISITMDILNRLASNNLQHQSRKTIHLAKHADVHMMVQ